MVATCFKQGAFTCNFLVWKVSDVRLIEVSFFLLQVDLFVLVTRFPYFAAFHLLQLFH